MRSSFILLFLLIFSIFKAQFIGGQIVLDGYERIYIGEVTVTNLRTNKKTIIRNGGRFVIDAQKGDLIRFTSKSTERKDITITNELLNDDNLLIVLEIRAREIPEVVIARFKPTGNLRVDTKKLTKKDKVSTIKEAIGLPKSSTTPTPSSPASFSNGGFNLDIQNIYAILSGEIKKKKRRMRYVEMRKTIKVVRDGLGDEYFTQINIPTPFIDNFLEFIYYSEDRNLTKANANYLIDKYTPIYTSRLQNSTLLKSD